MEGFFKTNKKKPISLKQLFISILVICIILIVAYLISKLLSKEKYDYTFNSPVNRNNWIESAVAICKGYERTYLPPPKGPEDCPDSSFTYTTNMGRFIPNKTHGGCIQLSRISEPNCWSDEEGHYFPWLEKLMVTSP